MYHRNFVLGLYGVLCVINLIIMMIFSVTGTSDFIEYLLLGLKVWLYMEAELLTHAKDNDDLDSI